MSNRVIDMRLDFPLDKFGYNYLVDLWDNDDNFGYQDFFLKRCCSNIGLSVPEVLNTFKSGGKDAVRDLVFKAADKAGVGTFDEEMNKFFPELDSVGVEYGVVTTVDRDNDRTVEILNKYGRDRMMGICFADCRKGMDAVRQLEYDVKERGLGCLYVSAYRNGLPADDRRNYPLFAKACELDIPVFIYSCMNYDNNLPMMIGHPSHIDQVARDFPDMRIMASVSGWPWVGEMMALGMRHKNVYVNLEVYEYKQLGINGSGFEMYREYVKGRLRKKLTFASMAATQGIPLKELIQQVLDLPLDDGIKEDILYNNAARFLRRD